MTKIRMTIRETKVYESEFLVELPEDMTREEFRDTIQIATTYSDETYEFLASITGPVYGISILERHYADEPILHKSIVECTDAREIDTAL